MISGLLSFVVVQILSSSSSSFTCRRRLRSALDVYTYGCGPRSAGAAGRQGGRGGKQAPRRVHSRYAVLAVVNQARQAHIRGVQGALHQPIGQAP
jgi:hypothetical protein